MCYLAVSDSNFLVAATKGAVIGCPITHSDAIIHLEKVVCVEYLSGSF